MMLPMLLVWLGAARKSSGLTPSYSVGVSHTAARPSILTPRPELGISGITWYVPRLPFPSSRCAPSARVVIHKAADLGK